MTEVAENLTRQEVDKPKLTPEGEIWFGERMPIFQQLTGSLLHEINNSLMPIINYSQLLEEELGRKGELTSILEGASRIAKLNRRLDFAAKACQRKRYSFKKISSEELESLLQANLGEQVKLERNFIGSSDQVLIDAPMLSTAFREMVQNSKEAGAKQISVGITQKEDKIEIELTDDGQGIDLGGKNAFDLNASTKVENGGARRLSVGLFIAKTIVLAHGGEIEIGNRKVTGEKGTIVRMTLPLADSGKV